MRHWVIVMILAFAFVAGSLVLIPAIGQDFFPTRSMLASFPAARETAGRDPVRVERVVFGEVERAINSASSPRTRSP